MSYTIDLIDPATSSVFESDVPHQLRGDPYVVGGNQQARLNITYNYLRHFLSTIDSAKGIRAIYGMTGAASIPILSAAIARLKDDSSEDYYEPTEGNARLALIQMRTLAQACPEGTWNGD